MVKFIGTERRVGGSQGLGEGNGELLFNGDRVSIWEGDKTSGEGWW